MNFIEQYVALRFRMWSNGIVWVLYESFPEEGEGVSKKLRQFDDGITAEVFFEKHKEFYTKWLQGIVEVKQMKVPSNPPTVKHTLAALKAPNAT